MQKFFSIFLPAMAAIGTGAVVSLITGYTIITWYSVAGAFIGVLLYEYLIENK